MYRSNRLSDLLWRGKYCNSVMSLFTWLRYNRTATSVFYMGSLREIVDRPCSTVVTYLGCLQVVPNERLSRIFHFRKSEKVTRGQIRRVRWLFQNCYWSEIYSPQVLYEILRFYDADSTYWPDEYGVINASRLNVLYAECLFNCPRGTDM
jgi:hypothetical protein